MNTEQNSDKSEKSLRIGSVIVSYLDKPKHRAILLIPQAALWVITATSLYLYNCFGLPPLPFIIPIHLISAGLLLIATLVILWSDFKRQKIINYNSLCKNRFETELD